MFSLSHSQAQIVNLPLDRKIQVIASAGSGKTRVLTARVRHILENTKRDGVMALTFTNKAAKEMLARLADCNQVEDRAWITTIHSFAQRVLARYGHTIGLPIELHIYDRDRDRIAVFIQSLRDEGTDVDEYLNLVDSKDLKSRSDIRYYMSIFSKIKRELLTELDVAEIYPDNHIWEIFQNYQNSLLNSGGIDYDDILVYAHRILLAHDRIAEIYRSMYGHVCVDEAQDLNKAQYEFIKAFCGDDIRSMMMVGDPDQMIYGFNGSSKDYFCTYFVEDFSPHQFKLKENYRSTKAVVKIANRLKPDSQTETEYALEGRVQISEYDTEEDEAEGVTSIIQDLLEMKTHDEIEGGISLDKMVIIARNRFVFRRLEDSLKEKEIPYSLRRGERRLQPSTKFGKVLDYAMRLKLNPKDWINGKKLCQSLNISEPESWTEAALSDIGAQVSSLKNRDSKLLARLISAIDELDIEDPNIPKFIREFESHLTSLVENRIAISDDGSEDINLSLEELNEFSRLWTRFKRIDWGHSLLLFRNALALGELSENGANGGLTLSTVHTMKGLEKDIVFLIGMCEGVFPDYRAKTEEELEEECNNAFVAVTRAKRWLYVSYPKQRAMSWGDRKSQQKSRFLEEIESSEYWSAQAHNIEPNASVLVA